MKKQLLSLALVAAALVPAFNANAEGKDAKLEEKWSVIANDLNAYWDWTYTHVPDWSSETAINPEACPRMGVGKDGKIYSIDMRNMSIIAFDADGWKKVYDLPKLEGNDYYGTAISMDDAGNFLIGHKFLQKPESSLEWSIFQPSTGEIQHFKLSKPNGWSTNISGKDLDGIGRTDCIGRVIGDMTKEAVVFLAPDSYQNEAAQRTRVIYFFGEGKVGEIDIDEDQFSDGHYMGSKEQNIAQPAYTLDEFNEKKFVNGVDGCIMYSNSGNEYTQLLDFADGKPANTYVNLYKTKAGVAAGNVTAIHGFDTFVIDGERFFVFGYTTNKDNPRAMDIAVYNEKMMQVAKWENPAYKATNGYVSITAEPLADGSANIYVYGSCGNSTDTGCVGAAMLNFTPGKIDETLGDITNPYKITTPQQLAQMADYLKPGKFYATLENDIDMTGVAYSVPMNESTQTIMHFNGKGHAIKNLTVKEGNASVFGFLRGTVEYLAVENIDAFKDWYCCGGIAGVANDAVIDNCYVTGEIGGAAVGGIVGANNSGTLTISNCYSQANIRTTISGESHTAGIIGRVGQIDWQGTVTSGNTTIKNSYASGTISAGYYGAGIGCAKDGSDSKITLDNVIAWSPSIEAYLPEDAAEDAVAPVITASATTIGFDDVNLATVYVFSGMSIEGEEVTDGISHADLVAKAQSWEAYGSKAIDGMPVLAWQVGEAGLKDIVVDRAEASDAPAVYYNLQGVRVANPEHGIYIRVAGNKATKIVK